MGIFFQFCISSDSDMKFIAVSFFALTTFAANAGNYPVTMHANADNFIHGRNFFTDTHCWVVTHPTGRPRSLGKKDKIELMIVYDECKQNSEQWLCKFDWSSSTGLIHVSSDMGTDLFVRGYNLDPKYYNDYYGNRDDFKEVLAVECDANDKQQQFDYDPISGKIRSRMSPRFCVLVEDEIVKRTLSPNASHLGWIKLGQCTVQSWGNMKP